MGTVLILSSLSLTIISWLFWIKALNVARIYEQEQASSHRVGRIH
jgi:hypothetical protein